ncbi:MAG: hypothetical protein Q8R92_03525 [Deltaproteobacteria bacterium]|nr:hypothetical protein [Deltaproteobacteria bacterium]
MGEQDGDGEAPVAGISFHGKQDPKKEQGAANRAEIAKMVLADPECAAIWVYYSSPRRLQAQIDRDGYLNISGAWADVVGHFNRPKCPATSPAGGSCQRHEGHRGEHHTVMLGGGRLSSDIIIW